MLRAEDLEDVIESLVWLSEVAENVGEGALSSNIANEAQTLRNLIASAEEAMGEQSN